MEFLRSLWPNSSTNVITIPQHIEGELEDDLNLKVKALTYLFKRLDIENLPNFINDENGIFNINGDRSTFSEKLDAIYNKHEFERMLMSDAHRILIDWFKNRFRSICILSEEPNGNYEEQLGKGFRFLTLKSDSTDDEYINKLTSSDIYSEHGVDINLKNQLIREILNSQRNLRPKSKKQFNKNDRANIILQYVSRLSEIVQIDRIYKASILTKLESFKITKLGQIKESIEEFEGSAGSTIAEDDSENAVKVFPNASIRSRSRSRSPIKRRGSASVPSEPLKPINIQLASPVKLAQQARLIPSSSPTRSINSMNSSPRLRSRSSSPVKTLRKKQSMTLLKMDKSLSSHQSDAPNVDDDSWITNDDKVQLRSQAQQAVLLRVEREHKLIREN